MKKLFREISKTDLLVVNGGADAYGITCHCWCQAADYLGGYVYELKRYTVSAQDCAEKCYFNNSSYIGITTASVHNDR